jgi:uncharacterized protein YbcI
MPDTRMQDGIVAADISRGAVQLLRGYTGCGPAKANTIISQDTVAIVLADTLTKGERRLLAMGEQEHVLHTRHHMQQLMRDDLVRLVETESGRHVEAFMGANHIDPDYGLEFFLLEPLPGVENMDGPGKSDREGG